MIVLQLVLVAARDLKLVGGCSGPGANQVVPYTGDGSVDGVTPHTEIYKDGFWWVGCKTDAMPLLADKFGDAAQSYDKGRAANTSIVRYDVLLDRENRQAMTPEVCFEFCRSVPEMSFFGLVDGRDCYCAHYYEPTAGAGGVCDLPCEGDPSQICGGLGKSSIYQMHECVGGLAQDLSDLLADADEVYTTVEANAGVTLGVATALQDAGDALELLGDASASPYAQEAKASSGPLHRAAEDLADLGAQLTSHQDQAGALNADSSDAKEVKQVETTMRDVKEILDASDTALAAASELTAGAAPEAAAAGDPTFVNILRQVEAESQAGMAVCAGGRTGAPKVGLTLAACQQACDSHAPKSSQEYCTAVQYFELADADSLCFLLTSVESLTTYACDYPEAPVAFLQRAHKKHRKKHHAGLEHHAPKHAHLHGTGGKGAHHAHHAHHAHAQAARHVRRAQAEEAHAPVRRLRSHPSSVYALKALRFASGAHAAAPAATCHLRFADTVGVTPSFKDGRTDLDRCFG